MTTTKARYTLYPYSRVVCMKLNRESQTAITVTEVTKNIGGLRQEYRHRIQPRRPMQTEQLRCVMRL